ncbi:ATP-binding cassette domain-containing protein [Herbiconiux daphne]|uniref:ATP-binding cassette domain-containing protein n=1 Tax=Herbiconiux daphne TaxID=2970914 RepID=A0ABT2H2B0_9MICO|nr:ATP-binding cassette domain-containing protein [Herbiconiux daphne]MCS5734065.1 ATP-binding cassette domain-containing protein [Herbiconiux daphne]
MSTRPMIDVAGLTKSYGSNAVLRGVDLAVAQGEIFALLGPNGAGKTTTVNVLTTLVTPDGGTARIAGVDVAAHPHRVRRLISLTGQYASVDAFQTGRENLQMMSRLAHLGARAARLRTDDLLEQFELTDAANRRAGTYSGGMRRRLDLAISLIAQPPVVFLDEPTTGLDPRSRSQMWDVVRALAANGTTILLTTQYLEEADQLADRVAVLDGGTVIATGTADDLKARVTGGRVEIVFTSPAEAHEAVAAGLGTPAVESDGLGIAIPTDDPARAISAALAEASARRLTVADIAIVRPSLDDVFFALTGHPASAAAAASGTDDIITKDEVAA